MSIRIVQLGSPRKRGEGPRLGTVRRPPRGVPKAEYGRRDFYDVWLPILSPSPGLIKRAQAARNEKDWRTFRSRFLAEMNQPTTRQLLDLLAALSHVANFSLGCYCENVSHCHRSVLQELLQQRGAAVT